MRVTLSHLRRHSVLQSKRQAPNRHDTHDHPFNVLVGFGPSLSEPVGELVARWHDHGDREVQVPTDWAGPLMAFLTNLVVVGDEHERDRRRAVHECLDSRMDLRA